MSKYTTGEIAKLCGVSVRTVQYYDTRNILVPTELSEGGRRLYSEEDLKKLKSICFLREMDVPINQIGELLAEDEPENVISILLDQQEQVLRDEVNERQKKLDMLTQLRRELKNVQDFSVETLGDIAYIMENKKKMKKLHAFLILTGIPMTVWQWASIILWIAKGIWWPFVGYVVAAIPYAIGISRYYFRKVAYICPQCHETFRPTLKEAFWARHTPTLRKLTCPHCGHNGFCVEIYGEEAK